MSSTTIRVALDWTPNTIHTGLYIALKKGFYSNLGLDVELLTPDSEYTTTPAKLLVNGSVDLAICPSETIIAYAENVATARSRPAISGEKRETIHLEAIYALLQKDASAIVSRTLASIRELDKGVYGSYNARYEDSIVRHMITRAGGSGSELKIESSTAKLSLFEELCSDSNRIDATWIFLPWEGVEAEMDGVKLSGIFTLEDSGIPYGYSPVIARKVSDDNCLSNEVLEKFVRATRAGYGIAMRDVAQAVRLLNPYCAPYRSMEFLDVSQERINNFYGGDEARLGVMKAERWEKWVEWLREKDLVKVEIDIGKLWTNKYNID